MGTASGFVLPAQQQAWMVAEPAGWRERVQSGRLLTHEEREEVVFTHRGDNGIDVAVERAALIRFDFIDHPAALMVEPTDAAFHWDGLIAATAARIRVMNAWAICFHQAMILEDNLDRGAFRVSQQDVFHYSDQGGSRGGGGAARLFVSDLDLIRIHGVVSEAVLRTACELVDAALASADGRVLDYLVLLNEALVAYKQHNWQLAVVAAWTVCEVLVDQDWTAFFMGSGKQINSARRQLLQGKDYPASVVTEVLNLTGNLDDDLHAKLNKVRSARNNWVHSMKPPTAKIANHALECAASLLAATWGRAVPLGLGLEASGL